jgi:hypothetical protein
MVHKRRSDGAVSLAFEYFSLVRRADCAPRENAMDKFAWNVVAVCAFKPGLVDFKVDMTGR